MLRLLGAHNVLSHPMRFLIAIAHRNHNLLSNAFRPTAQDSIILNSTPCPQALRPGGFVLIRDHGLYDMTHLRLRPEQRVSRRLFRRQDGTLCYFFSVEDLEETMLRAGFERVECQYACVSLRNRRRGLDMRRVFVHGVFRRP